MLEFSHQVEQCNKFLCSCVTLGSVPLSEGLVRYFVFGDGGKGCFVRVTSHLFLIFFECLQMKQQICTRQYLICGTMHLKAGTPQLSMILTPNPFIKRSGEKNTHLRKLYRLTVMAAGFPMERSSVTLKLVYTGHTLRRYRAYFCRISAQITTHRVHIAWFMYNDNVCAHTI